MDISVKNEAKQLVDLLPENATWDDLMHEIYVRQSIEKGLDDSNNDRIKTVDSVRKRYGL